MRAGVWGGGKVAVLTRVVKVSHIRKVRLSQGLKEVLELAI